MVVHVILDLDQELDIRKELLSINEEVILNNQLEMLSDSLLLCFLVDLVEGLSHNSDEHVQKDDSREYRANDE